MKPDDTVGMGLYINLHNFYLMLKIAWEFAKIAMYSKRRQDADRSFRDYRTRNMK